MFCYSGDKNWAFLSGGVRDFNHEELSLPKVEDAGKKRAGLNEARFL